MTASSPTPLVCHPRSEEDVSNADRGRRGNALCAAIGMSNFANTPLLCKAKFIES